MAIKNITFAAGHASKVEGAQRALKTRVDAGQMLVRLQEGAYIDLYDALEALNSNLGAEETRALAAEAAIQSDVDANEAASVASLAAATTDRAAIRSEIAAAKLVDDAALAAEVSRATAAEGVNSLAIAAEQARAEAAELVLTNALSSESAARADGDKASHMNGKYVREGLDVMAGHGLASYTASLMIQVGMLAGSELVMWNGMMLEQSLDYNMTTGASGEISGFIFSPGVIGEEGGRIVVVGLSD